MQEESQINAENSRDFHILRVGYYNHAGTLPLLYPLQAGWIAPSSPWKLDVVHGTAADLESKLLGGEIDAALLPPLLIARHERELAPLGNWGLAVTGRTETALLLAPERIDLMDGKDVSVPPEAQESSAHHLLQMLRQPYYGITMNLKNEGDEGYDPKGARLMYGDAAARESAAKPVSWVADDMGVAWFVLTGLPMVWELLAVSRDLEKRSPGAGEQIQEMLKNSVRTAREQQASVLQEAASRLGFDEARVKEQFARQRYSLAEGDKKGLASFLDTASRSGLIPR